MRIIDLYKHLKKNNKNILPNNIEILTKMRYYDSSDSVDSYYCTIKYNDFPLLNTFYSIDKVFIDDYENIVNTLFLINEYKYDKLYQTIIYKYEYDKNYNRTKEYTDIFTSGEKLSVDNVGEKNITDTIGKTSQNSNLYENGYDSNSPTLSNKSSFNEDEKTNISKTDSQTNRHTQTEYTDIHQIEEKEYGDLSVRTVAETIDKERKIAYFALYDVIFHDLMSLITDSYLEMR